MSSSWERLRQHLIEEILAGGPPARPQRPQPRWEQATQVDEDGRRVRVYIARRTAWQGLSCDA
jgi:hypothetical protein